MLFFCSESLLLKAFPLLSVVVQSVAIGHQRPNKNTYLTSQGNLPSRLSIFHELFCSL